MRSWPANGNPRLLFWLRVREFAVPPSMIETATARRTVGDWAGACAAARFDVDLNLRAVARVRGSEFAARIRADLRHLAPDLLRWHMPRVAPDGLLRPGLTISLVRYAERDGGRAVHLVVRTPPAWADAGQRISLGLWDESQRKDTSCVHPHPRPDRRFRLDLHRHLWDARRAGELRERSGAMEWPGGDPPVPLPHATDYAVHRWAAEAAILRRAENRAGGFVTVRLGTRRHVLLHPGSEGDAVEPRITEVSGSHLGPWPVLPEAATWLVPDLELLRCELIDADRLHPLVGSALTANPAPAGRPRTVDSGASPRLVECRGAQHRIGLLNGVLVALDHDLTEIRREELLVALGGTPLPCLRVIDEAHRRPESLVDVRARLDHGDAAGALAAVEGLLGPDVLLRSGALRDELETAALRRISYGLFRSGLVGLQRVPATRDSRRRGNRAPRRHAPAC